MQTRQFMLILDEHDRTILGTRYFSLLCQKASENIGKRSKFSKFEIYGIQQLDAYNKEIVIPLIIQKLKQLEYIIEYSNGEIGLTDIGSKHCGQTVVLDQSI